jgi:ribosomal protein L32
LIAIPVLLVAYSLVRRKSKLAGRVIGLGALALVISFFVIIFGPLGIIVAIVPIVAVILRRREKKIGRMKIEKPRSSPSTCPHCGRDLSTLPKDLTICPYCGEALPQRTCLGCGRDLSQFPADIKNCPYRGKAVSIPSVRAESAPEVTELPANVQRIRRYAKMVALFGLTVAISFFILIFLAGLGSGRPDLPVFPVWRAYAEKIGATLWSAVLLGVLLAIFGRIIQTNAGTTRFWRRRVAGKLMAVSTIALSILGGNLANTAYYPAYSPAEILRYQIGNALGVLCKSDTPSFGDHCVCDRKTC